MEVHLALLDNIVLRLGYRRVITMKYGKLTILEIKDVVNKKRRCVAKCDCGTIKEYQLDNIKTGNTTSCGCSRQVNSDIIGQKFGMLTVLSYSHSKNRKTYWLCKCDCGNEKVLRLDSFKTNREHKTVSCGCYNKIKAKSTTHGLSDTKLYHVWASMKDRCLNPNNKHYSRYGGRGIQIYPEWFDYNNFYTWSMSNGYEDGLSIDRIDNNGNYEPNNCKWTTQYTQNRNTSRNRMYQINGEYLCVTDIANKYNIKRTTLNARLNRGVPIEEAIKPVKK